MGFLLISAHSWIVVRDMKKVLGAGGRGMGKGQGLGNRGEGGGEGSLMGEGVEVGLEEGPAWVSVSTTISARVSDGSSRISPDSKGSRWLL